MNNSESSCTSSDFVKVVECIKNGKPIKFYITTIPKDRYEEAADHMCTYFLADEPLCKSLDIKSDPKGVQEFRSLFRLALDDNLSVGAFVENPDGGKTIMAALNILYLGEKQTCIFNSQTINSEKVKKIMQVMDESAAEVDTEKLYGSEKYIGCFGLSADPFYRGNAIGYHLFMARNEIGKKNHIPSTTSVVTSSISAKLAERAGFVTVCEKLRDEFVDTNGELLVPKCETVSIKCMGVHGSPCPEDSVPSEDGRCKCVAPCPTDKCRPGQQPFPVRAADPETPGSCCPLYKCLPSETVTLMGAEDEQGLLSCRDDSGLLRSDGESWQHGECVNCICETGKVSCQATMCKSCEIPTPPLPGECCPRCSTHHNATVKCKALTDCKLQCKNGYVRDNNDCLTCQCLISKVSGIANTEEKICPELPHCGLNCKLVEDEGGCPVCACQDIHSTTAIPTDSGEDQERKESEDKTVCPELKCDLHCENGLLMDENDCTLCQCKSSHPGCPTMSNCKRKCPFGYKVNNRGCSVCRCRVFCIDQHNKTYPEGSTWKPNSCTACSCNTTGRLSCKETICSVACSNPEPPKPGNCCPICPITVQKEENAHSGARSWGTVPTTLIVILTLLCVILMVHIVRNKFRGRLSPSSTSYTTYPSQYYKCVPIYDTPVHQNEKMIHL